ncbi:MAG: excinuclease ABC subunit UvrC [Nanohaloarchaea archaeon]|nr:excinuclease ABC subunit UvrC [Candidatus Nanohaloarchaea archaeon]
MLNKKITDAPKDPGVYLMKDKNKNIIYIGKAKNIRNRIKSYFSKTITDPKTMIMVSKIKDIDFIITNTEKEALILEAELVRKNRPKYNIELKDDRAYPYITVTTSDLYPRIIISRRKLSKDDTHFGPYANSVINTVSIIRKIFRIRDCRSKKLPKKVCLSYHMKRCSGPCKDPNTHAEYMTSIDQAIRFLKGDTKDVIKEIENNMKIASKNHEFESAAIYRDQLAQLRPLSDRQTIILKKTNDIDIIGLYSKNEKVAVNILIIRNGTVTATRHYILDRIADKEEMLESFIQQYYFRHKESIPNEILTPHDLKEKKLIKEWLSDQKEKKVTINAPKQGEKLKLIEMSDKNAKEAYTTSLADDRETRARTETLKTALDLETTPSVIECFDISTMGGRHSVGSMVQFRDGKPDKKNYRRFKIKTVKGIDDFAMMREVMTRRYTRIQDENQPMPDLILVDGGKGQLNVALEVFKELDIRDQPIISLAKKEEEIYLPNKQKPIVLEKDSKALLLLRHIRDESHRFAIGYHKMLRKKDFIK